MHAAVGRVVTAAWGHAYLNPARGRCHEENLLWGVGEAAGLGAHALAAEADRLLADRRHREIVLEGAKADALAGDLGALGYEPSRHLFLAHTGEPPPAPQVEVAEVPVEDLVRAEDRYLREDPDTLFGRDDETRAHLLEHHRTYGSAGAHERIFGVCHGPDLVAWAKLWTREGVAQVEDVVCLAEHRGRGYGRAVTAAATRAALAAAAELVFIVADDDDWPKELYQRLGYRTVGHTGVFVRLLPRRS